MQTATAYEILMFANKRHLTKTYGADFYKEFRFVADDKLREITPKIPDIGKSIFSMNYAFITAYVPFLCAFRHFDQTKDEAGELIWTLNENLFALIPALVWKLMGKGAFSERTVKRFTDAAELGEQGLLDPNDWQIEIVDYPDEGLGYNMTRCGALTVLRELGEDGVFPYACRLDYLMANRAGFVFERDKTLADGDDRCNMHFAGLGHTAWAPESGFELRR